MSDGEIVIAWQGLPAYARRCLRYLKKTYPALSVTVVTSRCDLDAAAAEAECGWRTVMTDSERPISFAALGLKIPRHFLGTSWSHAAYRALGAETKAAGGCVTTLVDNLFHGSLRQLCGMVYFRAKLRRHFDDAWVPGVKGVEFMRLFGMPAARIHAGLYGADPEIFSPPAAETERSGFVFAGQLIPRKGVEELWQAWRTLEAPPKLALHGEGPLRAALTGAGAPVGNHLAPPELAAALRRASALILPSRVDHWGLVLHEAALCGCLLLATRTCGAAHDLIVQGENGYILPRCAPDEIAKAVRWAQALTPARRAHGRALSAERAAAFGPRRWSEALLGIVRRQREEHAS
jgi:glycosyltransferase involved in cell wall biosynthesis